MSWGGAARPRLQPPISVESTPVSSGSPSPVASVQRDTSRVGAINLDLTAPNPVTAYHPAPGAGFSSDPLNQAAGLATNAIGGVIGLAADAVHGVDKLIGGAVNLTTGDRAGATQAAALSAFAAAPDTPEKAAVAAEIAKHPGDQYAQSQLAWEYNNKHNAYLFPELLQPFDSTATGMVANMLGALQAPEQVVQRTSAGLVGNVNINPLLLAGGMGGVSNVVGGDRIANIEARMANPSTVSSVTPTEEWAVQQVRSGQWTKEQGLDFLAGHSAGFSNDLATQMVAELVTDPTIAVPFLGEAARLGRATKLTEGGRLISGILDAADNGNQVASAMVKVAAKVNDIADPVGAIWGRAPRPLAVPGEVSAGLTRLAEPGARAAVELVPAVRSAYNYPMKLITRLTQLDRTGVSNDLLSSAEATYVSGLERRQLLRRYIAGLFQTGDPAGLLRDKIAPDDVIGQLIMQQPANIAELVERDALSVAKPIETAADRIGLAERMARSFPVQTAEEWAADMAGWSLHDLSYAHAITYAAEQMSLDAAKQRLITAEVKTFNPNRLTLMNASTMTQDGAAALLREIENAPSTEEAAALLRTAQGLHPQDLGWLKLDGTGMRLEEQVNTLRNWIEDRIFKQDIPAEINKKELAEIAQHEPGLAEMHARGVQGGAPWKLGYAPDETARWGLVYDSSGNLHPRFDVWATHVSLNVAGYKPLSMPLRFVNGRIAGYASNKLADVVDRMENATRVMTHSITSALVTENANVRLLQGLKGAGFTADEAKALSNGVREMVAQREQPIRSLLPGDLWNSLKGLVPARLTADNSFTASNLVGQIMRAYQGDFRYVGATQYLTGGMKRAVPQLGHLAEDVVPFLRFKLSLIFPTQMRVEGPFWSATRGIMPAFGPTPREVDAQTATILQRMAETSGRRAGDLDAAVEMSKQAMVGTELAQLGTEKWGQTWLQKITNAKGVEQLNYFRQFRHELYQTWKDIADRSGFDLDAALAKYTEPATERSGRWGNVTQPIIQPVPNQDEAVVRWLHELMGQEANPEAVVKPGTKLLNPALDANIYAPTNIGELRPIDVDGFLKRAPYQAGDRTITTAAELRKAIYRGDATTGQIEQHLRELNVPEDNIDRFMRAVSFDWTSFWREAARRFNMTKDEVASVQGAIAGMARKQKMQPSEYLSQIVSPTIETGPDALVRHIGDTVDLLRKAAAGEAKVTTRGAITAGISKLRAPEEMATAQDFVNQLAKVFVDNLHPSGQEALMEAFNATPESVAARMAERVDQMERAADAAPTLDDAIAKAAKPLTVSALAKKLNVREDVVPELERTVQAMRRDIELGSTDEEIITAYKQSNPGLGGGELRQMLEAAHANKTLAEHLGATGRVRVAAPVSVTTTAAAPLSPDADRIMREFSRWATEHIGNGLLAGKDITPEARATLEKVGLIPTDYAAPFNKSQSLMMDAALDHMAQKENDAYSLMYWRRSRSFLERSINHPLFGLYPASYMWGKVAPNYIRFLAKEPFGFKTGAGLNALRNVQMSLAARREFDPAFQSLLDGAGKSEALWFLGYLLPGAPWDLGASAPAWTQEMLRQADDNAARVARGLSPKPINLQNLLESEANFISPARGISAGVNALSETQQAAQGVTNNLLGSSVPPPVPFSEPVQATGLPTVLAPEVEALQQALLR